ncbi:exonuclease SbcC [Clostridium niameyense]|uniref:Nuclease SbcCD subunit C n=1 Tax=Clostridium niameyense TaxID=1622073 RepID=A0A6M0RD57_9CLOT|nr:AAA family ATPase [Clostridium niameyense]NEZ47489.1 exonuclease SbcC [Clostridium niameyense]
MKPKKLIIKGLNSFIEKQEIDFEKLTERGLFGIFGPTGSGKSSILDAITMALYGNIARDSSEFINTSIDTVYVDYEFEIGVGCTRKIYMVSRTIKRDKNGRYKTSSARLVSKMEDGEEKVVADKARDIQKSIENIIGLTSQDFTRSVVLPQGKFSEFLKLSGKGRRDMLERIFGLEKYGKDLSEKIRKEKNKCLKNLTYLEGNLKQYEGLSKDNLQVVKNEYKNHLEKKEKLEVLNKELKFKYEKYKVIWDLQIELNSYYERFKKLKLNLRDIEDKKTKVLKGKNALNVKPHLQSLIDTKNNKDINEEKLKNIIVQLEDVKKEVAILQKDYEKSLYEKDNEIPKLIEEQNKIEQAIDIEKKVKEIEKEKDELLKEHNKFKNKLKMLTKNLEKINEDINYWEEKLKLEESKINSIKVSPELRQNLQKLFTLEKEYRFLEKNLKDTKKELESENLIIKKERSQYDELFNNQKKLEINLKKLLSYKENLNNNCPGNSDDLLQKQNEVNKLKEKLNHLLEFNDRKKELNEDKEKKENKISYLKNEKMKIEKIKYNLEQEIDELEQEIKNLEEKNIAAILAVNLKEDKPCPVCGSIHHVKLASKVDLDNIKIVRSNKNKKEKQRESLLEKEKNIEVQLASLTSEEDLIIKELKKLSTEKDNLSVDELKIMLDKKIKEFQTMKIKLDGWNKDKEQLENNISKEKEQKSNIDKLEAKYKESISKRQESINKFTRNKSTMEKECHDKQEEIKKLKQQFKIEDTEKELDKIKKFDEKSLKLTENIKKHREKLEKLRKEKENINASKSDLHSNITGIIKVGKEKKNYIDKEKEEIKKLSHGRELHSYLCEIKTNIYNIKKKEENLKIYLEEENKKKEILKDNKLKREQEKESLKKLYYKQQERLTLALEENGFKNSEEMKLFLISKEEINLLEEEIQSFEKEYSRLNTSIENVEDKLKGESIKEGKWIQIQEEKKNNELELKKIGNIIIIKEKEMNDMEENLKVLGTLLNEKENLEHKKALLEDIDKLIQGNKFVEFVAINQLKYIAFESSKRLKDITRGRYALELDCSGNFTMRDDFNGGAIRPTNTLSGGETFLTSLALALALSSQIQLKGNCPLEFFFLDEGFGTLDTELLDTVMTSLESLRSNKLSIGIISHVEELKNRVPVKLIVSPAIPGQCGSKTQLEYS